MYGKLILNDSPTGVNQMGGLVGNTFNSMTSTLMAAQAAMALPSPAERVTHDLISPKYDSEEDDEDDDSDDTVYECPGLAAPGEMVVSNPFYLQGDNFGDSLNGNGTESPKPISQCSIFHHGIKGFN